MKTARSLRSQRRPAVGPERKLRPCVRSPPSGRSRTRRRGAALLVAIVLLTVVAALLTAAVRSAALAARATAPAADAVRADLLADAAAHLARARLAADPGYAGETWTPDTPAGPASAVIQAAPAGDGGTRITVTATTGGAAARRAFQVGVGAPLIAPRPGAP